MDKNGLAPVKTTRAARASQNHELVADAATYREITFPQGLVGCPNWHRFHLVPDPFANFGELDSLDEAGVELLVADPTWLQMDYSFELDEEDANALALTTPEEARVLCILKIQREPAVITANLAGPLVLNWSKQIGRQVVLDHQAYPLRAPVLIGADAQGVVDALLAGSATQTGRASTPHFSPELLSGKGA